MTVVEPHHVAPPLNPQLVGKSVERTEDPGLLSGRAEYIADLVVPGALHAAFFRSPHGHARITTIDTAAAAAAPGVHLVWTAANTAPLSDGIAASLPIDGMKPTVQPVLADGTARFVGEPLAVVVADSPHLAEDARDLIVADLEPLEAIIDTEAAVEATGRANDTLEDNVILDSERVLGDPDGGLADAAVRVSDRFVNQRYAAVPIETRGCIGDYDWSTGKLTLWSSTQMPHFFRTMLSGQLGVPEHKIEVIAPRVGGGFGAKACLFPEELAILLVARELGRPVRWIEDRRENLLSASHAKQQVNEMELGFSADGKLVALANRVVGDGGAYNSLPWTAVVEAMGASGNITSVYDVPKLRDRHITVATNKCPTGAYRGIGWTAPQIAREGLMERAARELGISPFEIRRRNVVQPEQFPYTTITGLEYTEGSYRESVDALEEAVGYEAFLERQRAGREHGRLLGLGVSIFNEITGIATRACFDTGFNVTTHDTSTVRMEPSGTVTVTTSITSQGQGQETTLAQVAADSLGVALENVVVTTASSTNTTTYGMGTWGSRGAVLGAGSIMRASEPIREKLLRTAALMLEVATEDLTLENGTISVTGAPDRSLAVGDVAGAIYFAAEARPPDMDPTLESTATYDGAELAYSNGGQAVILELDPGTGLVEIEKVVIVEDCGTVINPMIVEGQLRGGVAQAIGGVFLEHMAYDEQGQLLSTTFLDYLLPSATDVPDMEIIHLETPSRSSPGGIKGMGESSMLSTPAAIVNAVNDALVPFGRAITELPITPDRVLEITAP